MKKRALSLFLAFVMTLGLAAPAFAADEFLAEEPAAPEAVEITAPEDPVPMEAEAAEPALPAEEEPVEDYVPVAVDEPAPASVMAETAADEPMPIAEAGTATVIYTVDATDTQPIPCDTLAAAFTAADTVAKATTYSAKAVSIKVTGAVEAGDSATDGLTWSGGTGGDVPLYIYTDEASGASISGALTIKNGVTALVYLGSKGENQAGDGTLTFNNNITLMPNGVSIGRVFCNNKVVFKGLLTVSNSAEAQLSGGTFEGGIKVESSGSGVDVNNLLEIRADYCYADTSDHYEKSVSGDQIDGSVMVLKKQKVTFNAAESPVYGSGGALVSETKTDVYGTVQYVLNQDGTNAPDDSEFKDSTIPTATADTSHNAGSGYYVWWRVTPSGDYAGIKPTACGPITIAKATLEKPVATTDYTIDYEKETITLTAGDKPGQLEAYFIGESDSQKVTINAGVDGSIKDYPGKTIHVIRSPKTGEETNYEASPVTDIKLPDRPATPDATTAFKGLIVDESSSTLPSSNESYEYAIAADTPTSDWSNQAGGGDLTLDSGWSTISNSYNAYVRVKAVADTSFASLPAQAAVVSGQAEITGDAEVGKTVSAVSGDYAYKWFYDNTGSRSSTSHIGTEVTYTITPDCVEKYIWYTATDSTGEKVGTLRSNAVQVGYGAANVTIEPAQETFTYTGKNQVLLNEPVLSNATVKFTVDGGEKTVYTDVIGKDAGEYTIQYTATADAGYKFDTGETKTGDITVTIKPYEMTLTPVDVKVPYDGNAHPVTVTQAEGDTPTFAGDSGGGTLKVWYQFKDGEKSDVAPTYPGVYTVYASVVAKNFTIKGADADGYKKVGTLEITHVHVWSETEWGHTPNTEDNTNGYHWRVCVGEGECTISNPDNPGLVTESTTGKTNDYSNHSYTGDYHGWITNEDELTCYRTCDVCGYKQEGNHDPGPWVTGEFNEQHHRECLYCGAPYDKGDHEWEAIADKPGWFRCKQCGLEHEERAGYYPVEGKVFESDGKTTAHLAKVTLTPVGGGTPMTAEVSPEGEYSFAEVAGGTYTLTVTAKDGSVTVTELVEVTAPITIVKDIVFPKGKVSFDVYTLDMSAVAVDGLRAVAEKVASENSDATIEISMGVEAMEEGDVDKMDDGAIKALKEQAGGQSGHLSYLNVTIEKTVDDKTEFITDTDNIITLVIPYNFSGKTNVTVYRFHEGDDAATTLTTGDGTGDGQYKLDTARGYIYIYASKFSVYAIGYTEPYYPPSIPTTDKTTLNAAIAAAEALKEEDYTAESWSALETALAAAKGVAGNLWASQGLIDDVRKALDEAVGALVPVETPAPPVDKKELEGSVGAAEELTEEDWTKESWDAVADALAKAQAVLADANATQEEVDAALKALDDAMNGLVEVPGPVDKTALEESIAGAEALNAEDYTEDSWAGVADALEAAKAVDADETATQEEVDAAQKALDAAVGALDEAEEPVDKSMLEETIAEAEALNEADYTPETWAAEAEALVAAKAVYADESATQEEVDDADLVLFAAILCLEEAEPVPEVDKTRLETMIANAEALNEADYTPETWAAVAEALEAAKAVDADENATQDEVNAADDALWNAILALKGAEKPSVVDKTRLEVMIANAETLNEADYTPETWAAMAEALKTAKAVDADANATQDEVDAADNALWNAILALREAEPAPVVDKTALEQLITAAEAINEAECTPESWAAMAEVLKRAKEIYADPDATQEEVDAIILILFGAILSLEPAEPTPPAPPTSGTGWMENEAGIYFYQNGEMKKNYWVGKADGASKWNGNWYYVGGDGKLLVGMQYLTDLHGGYGWYFLQPTNANGEIGKMLTGWQWVGGEYGTGWFSTNEGSAGKCTYSTELGGWNGSAWMK